MSVIESEYSRHKVVIKDGTTQLCSGVLRRGTQLSYEMKAPIEDGFQRASIIGPKGAGLVSKIPYVGGIMSLFLMQNPCIQYEKEYQYSGHVAQKFKVSFIVFNDEKTGLEQLLRYILPHKGSQAEALEVAKVVSEILTAISYDIRIKDEADDSSIVARIKNAVRDSETYKSIEQFLSSEGLSDYVLKSSRELNESLIAFVSAKDTLDNPEGVEKAWHLKMPEIFNVDAEGGLTVEIGSTEKTVMRRCFISEMSVTRMRNYTYLDTTVSPYSEVDIDFVGFYPQTGEDGNNMIG